jgi:hypothetical protein
MQIVIWDRKANRVWVCKQRIHHGAVGSLLFGLGVLLMYHDRLDRSQWFRKERYLRAIGIDQPRTKLGLVQHWKLWRGHTRATRSLPS